MKKLTILIVTILSCLIFQQNNVQAATGFSKPNLAGSWYVYITVTETVQDDGSDYIVKRAGYVRGIISIDKKGAVVPTENGLSYYDVEAGEASLDITGGTLTIAKDGTVTGGIDVVDSNDESDTITIEHSKMDKGKTVISGIVKDSVDAGTYGMISAVKR